MDQFKSRVSSVRGWFLCLMAVGVLWFVMLYDSLDEYFLENPIQLTKLTVALLGTVIIWFLNLFTANRDWLESQRAAMEWQADHDLKMMAEMEKIRLNELKQVQNIFQHGAGQEAVNGLIGEEG